MEKTMENYLLKLADDTLIMGQRLAEWCGKGPYLEEDISLTNIALDYLGQSSNLYKRAAEIVGSDKTEDDLAFLRYEHEYLNCQLVEFPNGDYAQTILKVYFFSTFQYVLYSALCESSDDFLKAFAQKSIKEVRYHHSHSLMWLKIFNQGTSESQNRLMDGLSTIWSYTGGMFELVDKENELSSLNVIPDEKTLKMLWEEKIVKELDEIGVSLPEDNFMHLGGRKGYHTEYFGYILCELQYMQRAYPGCQW